MRIGNKDFTNKNTYIMGILNITPDSFSDGGRYNGTDAALRQAEKMICEGADLLDIGGESTRPDYTQISVDTEIERVVPIISAIKKNFDIPVSCDTYKSQVAAAALSVGADMINDIWGLKHDSAMAGVIKEYDSSVCLMHNRADTSYTNLIDDIKSDLRDSIAIAKASGIDDSKIIVDPGIGFAKTYEQNLLVTKQLEEFADLGYPLLYGASKKSMIGLALNLPTDERLEGTLATTAVAAMKGAMFIRVHDVKGNKRVADMVQKIINI